MGRHLKRILLGGREGAVKHPLSGRRSCRHSDPLARLNGTTCLSQNQFPVMPITKDGTRSCRNKAVAILLYCFFQFWRFLSCHLLHNLVVYTEISMDQLIAHPGHRSPLDVRIPRPISVERFFVASPITSMLRTKARFQRLVLGELFPADLLAGLLQIACFVSDVTKIFNLRSRHIRHLPGCEDRDGGSTPRV